jgi:hypothetical protein
MPDSKSQDKADRLKAALKENLKRRKAQAKGRQASRRAADRLEADTMEQDASTKRRSE